MIALIAGARPNFVKLAPILREMARRGIPTQYIHTLQHDGVMDLSAELGMREPDVALSNTKPGDLDSISMALTRHWASAPRPKAVVVVGDVTSTLAAALAATAHGIPIVHVEAGLRSGDFEMPEERNRAIVDRLSDLLLCTELSALARLIDEMNAPRWGHGAAMMAGNVMIDSLRWAERENEAAELQAAARLVDAGYATVDQLAALKAAPSRPYALVTIHRPSNVDSDASWGRTIAAVNAIRQQGLAVVWPLHPRTNSKMAESIVSGQWVTSEEDRLPPPQPYVDMVRLMKGATLVATDSGGVQEETTALGVPCLTLRENTERPITVQEGTNTIVGLDPDRVGAEVRKILAGDGKRGRIPEGWDGHAAERIVDAIQRRYT